MSSEAEFIIHDKRGTQLKIRASRFNHSIRLRAEHCDNEISLDYENGKLRLLVDGVSVDEIDSCPIDSENRRQYERLARMDMASVKGRAIYVTSLFGRIKGKVNEFQYDEPIAVMVEGGLTNKWGEDGWLTPIWDVTVLEWHRRPCNVRDLWVYGHNYNHITKERKLTYIRHETTMRMIARWWDGYLDYISMKTV